MTASDPFAGYDELRREFQKKAKNTRLLLVDLASSTAYKAQNPEIIWITRLKKFYEVVTSASASIGTCKLLGDGILVTCDADRMSPKGLYDLAHRILKSVDKLNRDFVGNHKINIRLVLNSGEVFPFDGNDPQGTVVDKLFRMEKFVPDNCIGMTEEFAKDLGLNTTPIARFPLKGLPYPATHGLILSEETMTAAIQRKLRDDSYLAALWAQPGADAAAKIILVGGHIPGGAISTVQMGDVNAKMQALHVLATLGFAEEIEVCDSSIFQASGYQRNIVAIGGPCFNSVTRNLLAKLPVEFEINDDGNDTPIVIRTGGPQIRLNAEYQSKKVLADIGLFVRMKNPNNPDRQVIIACGIESPGVEGIVQAFTHENPHFSKLMAKVVALGPSGNGAEIPDFFCVMRIPVELGHRPALPPEDEQVKYIYRL
jgi:hypothetical protein